METRGMEFGSTGGMICVVTQDGTMRELKYKVRIISCETMGHIFWNEKGEGRSETCKYRMRTVLKVRGTCEYGMRSGGM